MAITNAQQYQQLVNKPANGKRPGYRGDDAYGSRSRSNQATSSRAATSTSNVSPGAGNSRRGNEGPDDRSSARQTYNTAIATGRNPKGIDLDKGPPPLTEKEKQFVKDNPSKANLLDFLDPRKRFYNYARNLPGAKKSSLANLNAYRDYLVSQGADLSTIDRLMEGVDEENAIGFDPFQELAYDYEPKGIEDIETLRDLFGSVDESGKYKPPTTMGPFDKVTAVPQNFSDFMLTQRNNPNLFAAGDLGNFMDTPKPKDLVNPNTGELYTNAEWNDLKRDIGQDRGLMGGSRDDAPDDPCKGPNPPAYCNVGNDDDDDDTTTPDRNLGGLAPRFAGSIFDFTGLADGGRAGYQQGGSIMPRLNDLSGDVSSAEQMLQEINQRLQSAESTLGEGGGQLTQLPVSGTLANMSNANFNTSNVNLSPLKPDLRSIPEPMKDSSYQPMQTPLESLPKVDPPTYMRPGNIPGTDAPFSSFRSHIGNGFYEMNAGLGQPLGSPLQQAVGMADGGMIEDTPEGGIMDHIR